MHSSKNLFFKNVLNWDSKTNEEGKKAFQLPLLPRKECSLADRRTEFPRTRSWANQGFCFLLLEDRVCDVRPDEQSVKPRGTVWRLITEDAWQNLTYLVNPSGRDLVGLQLLFQQLLIAVTEWAPWQQKTSQHTNKVIYPGPGTIPHSRDRLSSP